MMAMFTAEIENSFISQKTKHVRTATSCPLQKSQEKSCELSGMPISQAHSEITEPPQLITSRASKLDSDSYITRSGRKVIPNKYLSDPV